MKLDLLNTRMGVPRDVRVFDSLEDRSMRSFDPQASSKTGAKIADIAAKGRCHTKRMLTSDVPGRFNDITIDQKGDLLSVQDRLNNMQKKAGMSACSSVSSVGMQSTASIIETFGLPPAPVKNRFLDYHRDKIHDDDSYTIAKRLQSKKLPGAAWSVVPRLKDDDEDKSHLAPGGYNVYESQSTVQNVMFETKKYFIRPEDSDGVIPLQQRLITEKREQFLQSNKPFFSQQATLQREKNRSLPSLDLDKLTRNAPTKCIKFSNDPRFDHVVYKQESYLKTTGLVLGPDYDKQFDKRIPFKFESSSSSGGFNPWQPEAASKDVDVDVDKYYSIVEEAKRSPVKYSAAFRSSAKVGMEIPPTTSPAHIGPGSFPNAYPSSVAVYRPDLPSVAFLSNREWVVRPASPEPHLKLKSFAEANQKGPIFPNEKSANGPDPRNQHMANLVKNKMTQIYPRLAKKKFPSPLKRTPRRTHKIK